MVSNKDFQKKFNKLKIKNNPFEYDFDLKIFVDIKEDIDFQKSYLSLINLFISLNLEFIETLKTPLHLLTDYCKLSSSANFFGNSTFLRNIRLNISRFSEMLKCKKLELLNSFYNNKLSDILFKIIISLNSNNSLVKYLNSLYFKIDNFDDIIDYNYVFNNKNSKTIYGISDEVKFNISFFPTPNHIITFINTKDKPEVYTFKILVATLELLHWINKLDDYDKSILFKFLKENYEIDNSGYLNIFDIFINDKNNKIEANELFTKIINEDDMIERYKLLSQIDYEIYINKFKTTFDNLNDIASTCIYNELISIIISKANVEFMINYILKYKEYCKANGISFNMTSPVVEDLIKEREETKEKNILNTKSLLLDDKTYYYNVIEVRTGNDCSETTKNEYNSICQKIKLVNKTLIKRIKNIKTYNQNLKNSGKSSGKLDMKNIYKYRTDKNIFYDNTYKTREQDLVFGILLDCSGSMYGSGIENGRISMIVLDETLKALNINHCIYGHTSDGHHHCQIMKYSYFKNSPKYSTSKNYSLANIEADNGNCDSGALAYVEKELLAQPNKDKICLIFSDGEPTECSDDELIMQVKKMEREGIKVIGIGIDFESISEYYNDYANGKNLKDMFDIIANILEQYVLEKVRR